MIEQGSLTISRLAACQTTRHRGEDLARRLGYKSTDRADADAREGDTKVNLNVILCQRCLEFRKVQINDQQASFDFLVPDTLLFVCAVCIVDGL